MIRQKVKIINPIENGSDITSRKRAIQYVESGRAVFVGGDFIRFVANDPRNQAAQRRASAGYEAVNSLMSKVEIGNIPLVRPGFALKESLTKRSTNHRPNSRDGRPGPVRVLFRSGKPAGDESC